MSLATCPYNVPYQSCAPGYGLDNNFDYTILSALAVEFPGMAFTLSGDGDSLDDIDLVGIYDPVHPQNGVVWAPKAPTVEWPTPQLSGANPLSEVPEPKEVSWELAVLAGLIVWIRFFLMNE